MGFFGKLKGKQAEQQAPEEEEESGSGDQDEVGGSSHSPTEWQHYYKMADHWGGMEWSNVEEFSFRYLTIEESKQMGTLEETLRRWNYGSEEEWTHVTCTFFRHHFGEGGKIPADDVNIDMYSNPQWAQAMTNASYRTIQDKQQQAMQADPGLVAPFEGVTIEMWAGAAARMAMAGADANAMAKILAHYQMDRAKYDRVQAEFTARMQRDMTGAISKVYGDAFLEAQGSMGMWGPSGGGVPGAGAGGAAPAAGGAQQAEPMSFEKYCEIGGAQAAWGEQGGDVNALTQQIFGISTMQLVNIGGYWQQKMMADLNLMSRFGELSDQYKLKYMAADPDSDLDLI